MSAEDKADSKESGQVEAVTLEDGQLYELDGGVFQVHLNDTTGQFELWTHNGLSGRVIARTGFDIDEDGNLIDRIYDIEREEYTYPAPPRFTLADLQPVTGVELSQWRTRVVEDRHIEDELDAGIWER